VVGIKKKEKIIIRYFDCHERENKIARDLKVSPSYITKIIKTDPRYWKEKADRLDKTKKRVQEYKRNWIYEKRNSKCEEYDALKREHESDVAKLSNMYKPEMSNELFVKCNRSVYGYCKGSSDLRLRSNINAGFTAPKRIRKVMRAGSIRSRPVHV